MIGSVATGTIIQIPEGWAPMPAGDDVIAAIPLSASVPIVEYPNYYQQLRLDERDVAKNDFATRAWWLLVARSLDGGSTFDDFEAFLQISATQPAFPINWTDEIAKTKKYVEEHGCEFEPGGCPKKTSVWLWVGAGAVLGVATLILAAAVGAKGKRR